MIQGKNYFYGKNKYYCYTKWEDNFGFFVFPAVMYDKNLPVGPELKVNRLTILLFRKRYVFDFGTIKNKKPFIWEDASIGRLIDWVRAQGKKFETFNKKDLEFLIKNNPKLAELLTDSGAELFYVKEMVLQLYIDKTSPQFDYKEFNF